MQFDEVDAGDFRICAQAVEQRDCYGFVAGVIVIRKAGRSGGLGHEAFRDESLAGGFTWATSDDALRFALNAGRDAVMCRAASLA